MASVNSNDQLSLVSVLQQLVDLQRNTSRELVSLQREALQVQQETLSEIKKLITTQNATHSLLLRSAIVPAFMCFMKLPLELREKIWQAMLPGPRIIEATFQLVNYDNDDPFHYRLTASAKPPVVLQVTRESRQSALLKLAGRLSGNDGEQRDVRFDPDLDSIYLTRNHTGDDQQHHWLFGNQAFVTTTLCTVKHLALDWRALHWEYTPTSLSSIAAALACFQSLESLTIVAHTWLWRSRDDCREGWTDESKSHDLYTFVDTANYGLEQYVRNAMRWVIYEEGNDGEVTRRKVAVGLRFEPEDVMVKLCMRRGKVCCDCESYSEDA